MATKTHPIAAQIKEIEAAIAETETSTDPRFLARPAARAELLEDLHERIRWLQAAERAAAENKAAADERDRKEKAWAELQPARRDLVARWQQLQQDAKALVADAQALDAEHRNRAGKAMASEPIGFVHLTCAELHVQGDRPIHVSPLTKF